MCRSATSIEETDGLAPYTRIEIVLCQMLWSSTSLVSREASANSLEYELCKARSILDMFANFLGGGVANVYTVRCRQDTYSGRS
jgi:hypothetical protein